MRSEGSGSSKRPRSRRARFGSGVVVALELGIIGFVVVLAAAVWIFIHALDATGRLDDARTDIQRIRADLLAGRNAVPDMLAAQRDAAAANHDTHDFVWGAAAWLPPVKSVRGITAAINTLAVGALPDVVKVGPSLRPAALRVSRDTIALAPLVAAAPQMRAAAAAATLARTEIANLPSGWFGLINTARAKVLTELSSLAGQVDDISRFATAAPTMLGEHGMRRYFVAIENNAEARATGGLVAAYAVVTADHGTLHVVEHGSDAKLQQFVAPAPVVPLATDYRNEYGNYHPAQSWITSNLSPNFPDAARIWAHLWQAQTGEHIDGTFGVDPIGLAGVLGSVGAVQVAGYPTAFTAANLATFIESTEYSAFPGLDNPQRKQFLSELATAVIDKLLSGAGNPQVIAAALGRAAGGGHLALWSSRPAEQAQISGTPLADELSATTAPFASVNIDNASETKLDYYVDRTLQYSAGGCSGSRRDSTITVTLTNTAPLHGVPIYARQFTEPSGRTIVERVPDDREFVFIHATAGASLLRATVNGKVVPVGSGIEQGHPVFLVGAELHPNQPVTVVIQLSEPVVAGPATTQVQPMARPQQTYIDVPTCH